MTMNSINNTYKSFLNTLGVAKTPYFRQQSIPAVSVNVGDVNATQNTAASNTQTQDNQGSSRKKLFGIIGISVGSALLLTVIGLFTLSKGFSGNVARRLRKISDGAKKAIYDLTTQSQELTESQKIKLGLHKGVQHFADAMQASSNISAIKDSAMLKLLKKMRLQPMVNSVDRFFKNKLILKTKNVAYNEAEYATIQFCNYLEKLAKQKNAPELAQKAKQIMADYSAKFSAPNHIKRSEEAWESMQGLHSDVYNRLFKPKGGFFKNLKQFRSYITTDLIAPRRNVIDREIRQAKAGISNNLTDVNGAIKEAFNDLKVSINPRNDKAVDIVKKINKLLEEGKNLKGATEAQTRARLFADIKVNLDELSGIAQKDIKDPNDLKLARQRIAKFYDIIKPDFYKKGLAQEAITDVKNMFEQGAQSKEYQLAHKYMKTMNTKLNNAIYQEMNVYEKMAELAVGSAPSDILGILAPTALGVGMIVNADNKDERISKTLTQGVPILGGVGVTYYGTVRGYTGAKNLMLGLGSGWILNIIGTKVDEYVKKYRGEQQKLKSAFESWTKLQKTQNSRNEQNG